MININEPPYAESENKYGTETRGNHKACAERCLCIW